MLQTLLIWHVTATAALLTVYLLVVALQWSTARLQGLADGARRRAAVRPAVALPTTRREDEAVALTGAA